MFRGSWELASGRVGVWLDDQTSSNPSRLFHDRRRMREHTFGGATWSAAAPPHWALIPRCADPAAAA